MNPDNSSPSSSSPGVTTTTLSQMERHFKTEHERLHSLGYDSTRSAAALMQLMNTVNDFNEMGKLAHSMVTQPIIEANTKNGLFLSDIKKIITSCQIYHDYTPLIRLIGASFSSLDTMGKSFRRYNNNNDKDTISTELSASSSLPSLSFTSSSSSSSSATTDNLETTPKIAKRTESISSSSSNNYTSSAQETTMQDIHHNVTGIDETNIPLSASSSSSTDSLSASLIRTPGGSTIAATPLYTYRNNPETTSDTKISSTSNANVPMIDLDLPPSLISASSSSNTMDTANNSSSNSEEISKHMHEVAMNLSSQQQHQSQFHTNSNTYDSTDLTGISRSSSVMSTGTVSVPVAIDVAPPEMSVCPVDVATMLAVYDLLQKATVDSEPVSNSLVNACTSLSAEVLSLASKWSIGTNTDFYSSSSPSATEESVLRNLSVLFILGCNPCLEDPIYHDRVVKNLCRSYIRLKPNLQKMFQEWYATADGISLVQVEHEKELLDQLVYQRSTPLGTASTVGLLSSVDTLSRIHYAKLLIKRGVDWTQQFITVLLCSGGVTTKEISEPVAWLSMLNGVNELVYTTIRERPLPFKDFYNQMVSEEINLKQDHDRWSTSREQQLSRTNSNTSSSATSKDIFSFCSNPFILDAAAKAKILEFDAKKQMEGEFRRSMLQMMFSGMMGMSMDMDPRFNLRVRRDHLLEDALQGIVNTSSREDLKKPLNVIFVGEEGLDAGGVRKEFFTLITRQLFDAEFGMFIEDKESHMLFFRPDSMEPPVNFELIGALIGLALYNAVILDLALPLVLYRKLKGETPSLRDLDDWQPSLARSLRQILAYQGNDLEDVFSLTFSVDIESFGEKQTIDLVPGGSSKAVTKDNVREYVRVYLQWLLVDSIKVFYKAFERGFKAIVGGPALELFRAEELAEAIRGSAELDFESLEKSTTYEQPFHAKHPVIINLWAIVRTFTEEEKRKFLHFCTGSDRAPLRGLGSINFIIGREPDSDRLPTSHTCFNHLIIPEYPTKEKLETKLRAAIQQSEGFGLI